MDEQVHAAWKRQCRGQGRERRDALGKEARASKSQVACEALAAWLGAERPGDFLVYIPFRTELDTAPLIEWGWQHGWAVCAPLCIPEQRAMDLYRLRAWEELAGGAYGIREPAPDKAEAYDGLPAAVIVPGLAFDRRGGRVGYGGGYYDRLRARYEALEQAAAAGTPGILGAGGTRAGAGVGNGVADGASNGAGVGNRAAAAASNGAANSSTAGSADGAGADRRAGDGAARGHGSGKRTLWIGIGFEAQVFPEVPMDRHDLRLDVLVTEAGVQIIV